MTKLRNLLATTLLTATLLLAGMTLPGSLLLREACADGGCGQGSNECRYDCPGSMNRVPTSDPYSFCECEGGECEAVISYDCIG